jgi:hypothetical protein
VTCHKSTGKLIQIFLNLLRNSDIDAMDGISWEDTLNV